MPNGTIEVYVNGAEEGIGEGTTVAAMLREKNVRPELVAVEINGEILSKGEYEKRELKPGDCMEWLFYMAGGAHSKGLERAPRNARWSGSPVGPTHGGFLWPV